MRIELKRMSGSTSEEFGKVQRSKVLLVYADGISSKEIENQVHAFINSMQYTEYKLMTEE